MPNRVCRRCGKEYEGPSGSSLCPVCVKAQRHKSNLKMRTCRTCGAAFPGGPRAYYCPACRSERAKEANRRCKERKAAGKSRAIGSVDICSICGKPYTVASGQQKFCEACATEQRNAQALARYHSDPDIVQKRRDLRAEGNPQSECIICGESYTQSGNWLTCSSACSRIHAENLKEKWAAEHPERRAELNKDWYRRYFESLTPDELEKYRESKRESARTRYHKNKEQTP